jgi:hypothetical protein
MAVGENWEPDMWDSLDSFPDNQIDAYSEIIEQINRLQPRWRTRAFRTLTWILSAQRPLTMDELKEVVMIECGSPEWGGNRPRRSTSTQIPDDTIIRLCRGLVIYERSSSTVRFNHKTVQEFLESDRSGFSEYKLSSKDLAMTCLMYLGQDELYTSGRLDLLEGPPFALYAARFWGFHVRGDVEYFIDIQKAVLDLLKDEMKRIRMLEMEALALRVYVARGQTLLHIISRMGLATICKLVLQQMEGSNEG